MPAATHHPPKRRHHQEDQLLKRQETRRVRKIKTWSKRLRQHSYHHRCHHHVHHYHHRLRDTSRAAPATGTATIRKATITTAATSTTEDTT